MPSLMRVIAPVGVAVATLVAVVSIALQAQGPSAAALTGVVSSQAEGRMEGVLVNARREGANFTVTVVSDAQGRYSFPRTHLVPGKYAVTIRATGLELGAPATADVAAARAATLDLTVQPAKDPALSRTSLEWLMSFPWTPEQKDRFAYQAASCNYCHTYERIVKSRHTAEQFMNVMARMRTYYPDGTSSSNDGRGFGLKSGIGGSSGRPVNPNPNPNPGGGGQGGQGQGGGGGGQANQQVTDNAKFMSEVNLSAGRTTWPYELKSLPRPSGAATRVIVTQWDMPRAQTVSHDMDVDSKGNVWYADESHQFLGRLDPKTNTFTEFPMPPVPAGVTPGTRDVQVDKDDNVWTPVRIANGASLLSKFEPKTQKLTMVDEAYGQFVAMSPDGKMWVNVAGSGSGDVIARVDPKTMKVDAKFQFKNPPTANPPGPYQMVVSSKGNPYSTSLGSSLIIAIDAATGDVKYWPTPTPRSGSRRGRMDAQDRYWFAQYFADRVGMFDTRTEKFTEWQLPTKWTTPYVTSVPDHAGYVYYASNMSERVGRLDPKTGAVIEYLIPTNFDAKKIALDPSTKRVTLWMSNKRTARVTRVEPLD